MVFQLTDAGLKNLGVHCPKLRLLNIQGCIVSHISYTQ